MADFDKNKSWLQNNDTSIISVNIKKHIKHGRHRTKYNFTKDPLDKVDLNIKSFNNGIDNIKALLSYMSEMNLGEIEFSVFQCKSKSKVPAYYANIKLGNTSLASSFPEKLSLPELAKQVAARNALAVLKRHHNCKNIPLTLDMNVVAERLEKELQKNFAGLFCDKVEDIYKEVYNESLPSDWLINLRELTTNIIIEDLPKQNKSILYYAPLVDREKNEALIDGCTIITSNNLPQMKFVDKSERSVIVTSVDSNHIFWVLFVHDSINVGYDTLFKLMNLPDESKYFCRMFNIELFDVYVVQVDSEWYRFQVHKIEEDNAHGIFIDLGMEWCVSKSNIMFLPEKFLKVPSQSVKCALKSLFFAPYFQVATDLFHKMLFGKEFTIVPDDIEPDIPMVTLYNGKFNINSMIMDTIIEKTNFIKIDKTCERANLSYLADGYLYLHPPNETLLIMESILDSISVSRPLNSLYSKKSISPHKMYLVKCTDLEMWSRAVIDDFIFTDQKFKVFFVDYGNYGFIDQDKFIDLESVDTLLATISPQALKVSFNLFPPEKLTVSQSKALYEMIVGKPLDIEVVSTDKNNIQVVEIFDANDQSENRVSFNTLLYQSV